LGLNVDARLIGIISKAHGVKGEVLVELITDYPKTIKKGDIFFFDEKCTEKVEVENIRLLESRKNRLYSIIKFKGKDNREYALKLKGSSIFRGEGRIPELRQNQYWSDDIIGCRVYTRDNVFIGEVVNVEKYSANDNLVVKINNKKLDIEHNKDNIFYIPAIKDYIDTIDLKTKKIILNKIPEYI
jgi:16S rRNA processing protein RimM